MSSLHSDYLPDLLNMPVNDLYEGIPPIYAGSNITKTSLLETFKKKKILSVCYFCSSGKFNTNLRNN